MDGQLAPDPKRELTVQPNGVFKKLSTLESVFLKDAFSVTAFTGYVYTVGQSRGKKISIFKRKRIHGRGLSLLTSSVFRMGT